MSADVKSDGSGTEAPGTAKASPAPSPSPDTAKAKQRKPLRLVLVILALFVVFFWILPKILESLRTVSTDDAYVNSHVTFVAPRVGGQVARVLVDDNNRVRKGDLLVELDKEPYRVQVEVQRAVLDSAQADLIAAQASVRGMVAQVRSQRFKLQHAIEAVDNQAAVLRASVAALDKSKATLTLAQSEFDRYKQLLATRVASREEIDQRRETLDVAQAEVNQALEDVHQDRVALGLPAQPDAGQDLAQMPPDLDQIFSAVRQAQFDLGQSAAQLNIIPSSYDLTPKQMIGEFYKRDPKGDIDRIYASLMKDAPAVMQANAKLLTAKRDLDQAELNLRYCDIVSEIDGVVTRRNVNPGNNVQVGQSLMAVRSLREVWVDANFKETQLARLRIGQPVDLRLDMYGKGHVFKGRISGFTMGTGSTLALLPPENATGNFIKVVQRLPVRIDLIDYDADKYPLFVGLSVIPLVHIREKPAGPDAGKFLQPDLTPATAAPSPEPATP